MASTTETPTRSLLARLLGPAEVAPAAEAELEWSKAARTLLPRGDRFASQQIVEEFKAKLDSEATVALDGNMRATHVLDDNYAVIWQRRGNKVHVAAVVVSPLKRGGLDELKSDLEKSFEQSIRALRAADR